MALDNGHRLLTQEEYEMIIKEGRATEVLKLFVRKKPGRKPKYSGLSRAEVARMYRASRRRVINDVIGSPTASVNSNSGLKDDL